MSRDMTNHNGPIDAIRISDRIKELRRVRARDLLPNPKNWRRHPKSQVDALRGLLTEVGYADALLARELSDGKLMLIDGHLRRQTTPDVLVPVLVLDVTEEEADKILATHDPLAAMAESDAERLKVLLATVQTDSDAVQELLRRTAGERLWEALIRTRSRRSRLRPRGPTSFAQNGALNLISFGGSDHTESSAVTAATKLWLAACGTSAGLICV